MWSAQPAAADTFEVTRRDDPVPGPCIASDCSLREAVVAANARVGMDRIVLPSRKRYQLAIHDNANGTLGGDLDVVDPLLVVHPGPDRAVIDNNPPDDEYLDPLDRIFEVAPGAALTLKKLEITDGGDPADDADGGGIRTEGDLTLLKTWVVGNEAPGHGGGIDADIDANLIVRDSVVSGNTAHFTGGGIRQHTAAGPGGGRLTISRSTISDNTSELQEGAGVYFSGPDDVQSSISGSTISGNQTSNEGGGLYTDAGNLTVTGTTIDNNVSGSSGGGVTVDGPEFLSIVNSTIARNRADGYGGGIDVETDVSLNAVTIARNRANADGLLSETGGGVYVEPHDTLTTANSLIALNTIPPPAPGAPSRNDCAGDAVASAGFNLISTAYLCSGFVATGDIVKAKPKLGKLRDNGGPTRTIALLEGSPAIGAGSPSSAPERDQRGHKRKNPDIGAFER